MNNNQYINGLVKMILLVSASILLSSAGLLSAHASGGSPYGPPPSIICPDDIVQANDPGECSAIVNFTPPGNSTLITGLPPGSTFPVGITNITYMENTDSTFCSFTVTVTDSEPPEVFCPQDLNTSYDEGICQAVSYDLPTATDNCGVISLVQTAGLASGSVFPEGTTVNVFEAEDAAGNVGTCSFSVIVTGGNATILATDGTNSQQVAPQGATRYQRSFFLVSPSEMAASGLETGMEVNAIGFTIGAPQTDTTTGHLKVYLQNTTDTVSRIDTAWTQVTASSGQYGLSGISPGDYEWQVRALCSNTSGYSETSEFSNEDLSGCNQPYNMEAKDITGTTATLVWESSSSGGFINYLLEYSPFLSDVWDSVYTTDTFYLATGLSAETNYQWRVRSLCSGDRSPVSASSFGTGTPDNCNEPSGLATGTLTGTSVELQWTEAGGASFYEVQVRRSGTMEWISSLAFTTTALIEGLNEGTTYEWKVKANCSNGSGSFVTGPSFVTTGSPACYAPRGLKTSGITPSGAVLSWLPVPGATSYEIRYRLKESISWDHAKDPMTLVSDGMITVPDTIGTYYVPFEAGSTFTYNGNGIYVAWEYSRPSGPLSSPNVSMATRQNTVIKDSSGQDSVKVILSFNGRTDAASATLPETLRATELRPEIRLGSPSLSDSLEVVRVYAMGLLAIPYGSPASVSALIKNYSALPKTVPATLTVVDQETGATEYTEIQNILLPAHCGEYVTFNGWAPSNTGVDSIIVTVPAQNGENVSENNRNYYLQEVNNTFQGYDDGSEAVGGAGFGTGEGLILSKFTMNGCGKVHSASIYLHWSAAGHSCFAVILDSAGTILDSSVSFTPDSTEVNEYHSFYFPNTPLLNAEDYYVGLAQQADPSEAYYPVGVQWEGSFIRDNAYYRADLTGTNLLNHPYPGRLMIRAELLPGIPEPFISGSDILCNGSTETLQAGSKSTRFANSVLSYSTEYSSIKFGAEKTLGSPDVYPGHTSSPNAWISETPDGQREYIVLGFPDPSPINFIDIYETFNPGAIDTVYIKDDAGDLVVVYTDSAKSEPPHSKIKQINFPLTSYDVTEVRIALNSPAVQGHNAIDAVGIGQIIDPGTFASYIWSPGGETTQSISINSPGTYVLTVSNGSDCSFSDSLEVTTPAATTPTILADGPTSFCEGGSVILTSGETKNNLWSTGDTTRSITVTSSGTYYVEHANGCDTTVSANVVVTVHPLPVVTISGGPICPGGQSTLDAGAGFSSYSWSTGETTQTIDVSVAGFYSVTVTNGNGCEGSGNITTFYVPAPVPVISGDPGYCQDDSTLLDAGGGFASYLWSTGETTRQVYAASAGELTVTVFNEYGCSGTAAITIQAYPAPSPIISGTLSLCAGSTTVLDAGPGYTYYEWSTGEYSRSIVVDTADTFTVTVTDENGCTGTSSVTTTTDGAIPPTPGAISGPVEGICMANGIVYSVESLLNTTHYVWTVPEEMTIMDGQGTHSITVDVGLLSSGVITVAASNACGQSPTWNGRTLTVHGAPGVAGYISGQVWGVCGLNNVSYSVEDTYGAGYYSWTVPEGATITGGQGTTSVTVSFGSGFSSGDICVQIQNDCGNGEERCLTVSGMPGQPGLITGPDEVCSSQEFVEYSIDPVVNADYYTWTVPHQATVVSGQGTNTIEVTFGNTSGPISVHAQNSCGSGTPQTLHVNVIKCGGNNSDAIIVDLANAGWDHHDLFQYMEGNSHAFFPEVIASSGDYASSLAGSLSWTIGEMMVETAGENQYILSQGFHQSYLEIVSTGEEADGITFNVEIYPVPARDILNIRILSHSDVVNLKVELFDMTGIAVYTENVKSRDFHHQIPLGRYPTNMFFLKVTDTKERMEKTFKIIRVRL